jgi:peptidyl-prolyl cis-trans isomerase A (cyclophilin A)
MSSTPRVVLETDHGDITIDIGSAVAPLTARYVLGLVADGCFDGASFYRSTDFGQRHRRRLVQGGPLAPLFTGSGAVPTTPAMLDTVESTSMTGLAHVRGAVSLARDLFSTGHVLPELFICLDAYPELDEGGRSQPDSLGFPAFGSVSDGLGVVDAIATMATDGFSPVDRLVGEVLTRPVTIIRATSADPAEPEPNESSP